MINLTPFTVGRMRWLDLLALYHRLNPDSGHGGDWLAGVPPGHLAALILDARMPPA